MRLIYVAGLSIGLALAAGHKDGALAQTSGSHRALHVSVQHTHGAKPVRLAKIVIYNADDDIGPWADSLDQQRPDAASPTAEPLLSRKACVQFGGDAMPDCGLVNPEPAHSRQARVIKR